MKRFIVILVGVALMLLVPATAKADYTTDYYGVTNSAAGEGFTMSTPSFAGGAQGTCRSARGWRTRTNSFGTRVYTYNESVYWCWRTGLITYSTRVRWVDMGSVPLWGFDGHVSTNCAQETCPNRGVGTSLGYDWTQGQFHACLGALGINICSYKTPQVGIHFMGNGGAYVDTNG